MKKKEFIIAYRWMFGATKKEAEKAYKRASEEYIQVVINGFKINAKTSFYID